MGTKRTKQAGSGGPVNCEICRHFTGYAALYEFACAKGHPEGDLSRFVRRRCADSDPMTRDEQILKRFASGSDATHRDASALKNCQMAARRTAGNLDSLLERFGKYLVSEEVEAAKGAATVLRRLGNDLARAAKTAKQQADAYEARFEAALKEAAALIAATAALNPTSVADQMFVAWTGYHSSELFREYMEEAASQPTNDQKPWRGRPRLNVTVRLKSDCDDVRRELARDLAHQVATRRGALADMLAKELSTLAAKRPRFESGFQALVQKVCDAAAAQAFVAEVTTKASQ